jgi:hypothetical protein
MQAHNLHLFKLGCRKEYIYAWSTIQGTRKTYGEVKKGNGHFGMGANMKKMVAK